MQELFHSILGPSPLHEGITVLHMAARAAIVYLAGLVLVRLGKNRLLGRTTAFDIILAFILGSLLSRAINGGAPMGGSLLAAAVLVALHWVFALLTYRSDRLDRLFKGSQVVLVRQGRPNPAGLRRAEVSAADLMEAVRLRGGTESLEEVSFAGLERNGEISVVLRRGSGSSACASSDSRT